jgi:hypothetical protein
MLSSAAAQKNELASRTVPSAKVNRVAIIFTL